MSKVNPDLTQVCPFKIWWKDYEVPKIHNLESVFVKNELFFSPTSAYPPSYNHLAQQLTGNYPPFYTHRAH
jgi:hypothetical protein